MKLVVMTKPTFFVEEDKILATLFDEGMDYLHLYKPGSSPMYAERLLFAKKKSEYVFLKYIFDSQSEPDKKSCFTTEELQAASRQGLIDRHVYALGGINLDNIKQMKDFGFGGVVLCGDLWNRFDIHEEQDYRELITHFVKIRKALG